MQGVNSPSSLSLLRFRPNSRKVKFVVSGMCADQDFPVRFTDFQVKSER